MAGGWWRRAASAKAFPIISVGARRAAGGVVPVAIVPRARFPVVGAAGIAIVARAGPVAAAGFVAAAPEQREK